ncbi:MAG: chromate efflux transporter [Marinobacter sp.]|uniref:chromate efflux transporter n=1 Tax=Marinobacter sp. TaxID=50741 RepID=UPI00299E3783|nr:chromate efflux transporter [Marinobacter sp.]MDX1633732.1 chromate efflux transporter [Marinobacter sp.]
MTGNQAIPFREALAVWWRIGLLSFGGPAGQIALMHRIIVDEKRWLDEPRFLHALNYCMLLPGPEAQQLATYVGWLLHGVRGGLVAGLLFILPGALLILALSWLYVLLGGVSLVAGLFVGLKAAVLAIVVQALIRIGGRALNGVLKPLLAVAGFLALFVFDLPFPLVVLGAGLIGFAGARWFARAPAGSAEPAPAVVLRPGTRRAALVCLGLWLATVFGLLAVLGPDSVFSDIAVFFSKMAMVTFGGAYAVLAYVAQQGVESFGWLQPGEMLDGLGLAETTPGPLILVTQFVGFLAAFREAGAGGSLLLATLGAGLTTWVTFLPCFLWIFAGAPYVEKLRGHRALSAALAAITAAVVGVIANLALWFAINALFDTQREVTVAGLGLQLPEPGSVDLTTLAIAVVAFVLVFGLRLGILPLLASCALLGMGSALLAS